MSDFEDYDLSEQEKERLFHRLWDVVPDKGDPNPLKSIENIKFFERESFASEEAYQYMRCFLESVRVFFMYAFMYTYVKKPVLDVEDFVALEKKDRMEVSDLEFASDIALLEFILDPDDEGNRYLYFCKQEHKDPSHSLKGTPIDQWEYLPDILDIHQVADLIGTTPKNVRNLVNRQKDFPTRIAKPGFRTNFLWQWKKKPFLEFVKANYGHLYEKKDSQES